MANKSYLAVFASIALFFGYSAECDAQSLLKGLKSKAEQAISNKIGSVFGENKETSQQEEVQAQEVKNEEPAVPTATDRVPKMRQSKVAWDGEITPSRATDAHSLMQEFPPFPSPAEIADPNDNYRESYHRILTSIYLRAQELDEKTACTNEEIEAQREKIYKDLEEQTGLTSAEIKLMEDPDTPQEVKEELQIRAANKMFGMDMGALQNKASASGDRREQIEAELAPLEKKIEKGQTLTAAEQKRYDELQQEQTQMAMEMMSMMGDLMGQMDKISKPNTLQANSMMLQQRLAEYSQKVAKVRMKEMTVTKSCEQIAKEYEQELKNIYSQIWVETDAEKIHALYDKADDLVKNYRTRAAEVHLKSLQTRINNVKALLPEAEKLYKELVEAGIAPECVSSRPALNLVVDCVDIMQEAYADFPQPDFISCCSYSEVKFPQLQQGDNVYTAESGYGGSLSTVGFGVKVGEETLEKDFVANSQLLVYNQTDKSYYKIQNGARTKLSGDGPFDFAVRQKRDESAYGSITLRDGKRKAVYSKDGALTLHDASVFYPVAMQRLEDRLVFIIPGNTWGSFVKCTYKL